MEKSKNEELKILNSNRRNSSLLTIELFAPNNVLLRMKMSFPEA
jgi:hypothetical protein